MISKVTILFLAACSVQSQFLPYDVDMQAIRRNDISNDLKQLNNENGARPDPTIIAKMKDTSELIDLQISCLYTAENYFFNLKPLAEHTRYSIPFNNISIATTTWLLRTP